jgi:hypothetical protein
LFCACCVPPRTLIIKSAPHPQPGVTYGCDVIDNSSQSATNPPLEDTCPRLVQNSDPDGGVPDNHPNTRNVYAGRCDQIYELRIFDPSSDHPRVTITCVSSGGP